VPEGPLKRNKNLQENEADLF
jgi:ribosomal protein L29